MKYNNSKSELHSAIRYYGIDNFELSDLYTFESNDIRYSEFVEDIFIKYYKSIEYGYNMGNSKHRVFSEEYKRKDISGINNPMYGKKSGNAKRVMVNNIEYDSVTMASELTGINYKTLHGWIANKKEKYKNYYYIN